MIVLDSSAVLAVLLGERGADAVVVEFPDAVISAVTLTEILGKAERRGLDSEIAYQRILDFGIGVIPADSLHARMAAKMVHAPRRLDLSLGDRLCIALAVHLDCALLTSDRGMIQIEAGIPIRSFR